MRPTFLMPLFSPSLGRLSMAILVTPEAKIPLLTQSRHSLINALCNPYRKM